MLRLGEGRGTCWDGALAKPGTQSIALSVVVRAVPQGRLWVGSNVGLRGGGVGRAKWRPGEGDPVGETQTSRKRNPRQCGRITYSRGQVEYLLHIVT